MNFINAKGHIVIDLDGKYYVVDTGAPTSFNFDSIIEKIYLDGKGYLLKPNSYDISSNEEIEKLVGKKLYGFIGFDIISDAGITVDYNNNIIDFNSNGSKKDLNNIDIDADMFRIIITNNIKIDGNIYNRFILDTGAITSYLLKETISNSIKLNEKYKDYSPYFGNMEDYYYKINVTINNETTCLKVGNASYYSKLESHLKGNRTYGVVGLNFISDKGYFVFDFKNNKLWFK